MDDNNSADRRQSGRTILYHDDADGFAAAWVLWHVYGPQAKYIAVNHGQPPPWPDIVGRQVMIVDFAYPLAEMLEIGVKADTALCLDHHKTAADRLRALPWCHFDIDKAGCRLAKDWVDKHFAHAFPSKYDWVIDHVEDVDLGRWSLPAADAIVLAFSSIPAKFTRWTAMADEGKKAVLCHGQPIANWRDRQADDIADRAKTVVLSNPAGIPWGVANVGKHLSSAVGRRLTAKHGQAICWQAGAGRLTATFYSADPGIDVSAIATAYGGGGHAHAAGAVVVVDSPLARTLLAMPADVVGQQQVKMFPPLTPPTPPTPQATPVGDHLLTRLRRSSSPALAHVYRLLGVGARRQAIDLLVEIADEKEKKKSAQTFGR